MAIKTYKIKCGKLKPPGQKSARIRGPGHIHISDGSIDIDAKALKEGLAILYMIVGSVLTAIVLWLIYRPWGKYGIRVSIGFWLFASHIMAIKPVTVRISISRSAMYYMERRKIICLRLDDGRWLAIRAQEKEEREQLFQDLKALGLTED